MQLNCYFRPTSCMCGTTRKWITVMNCREAASHRSIKSLLLAMKLTAIILFTTCLHVAAKTTAQTVSFSGQDVPLEKVFSVIKEQTDFVVFYDREVLSESTPVSITASNLPLTEFLTQVLQGLHLGYSIKKKTIVIKKIVSIADVSPQLSLNTGNPPITGVIRDLTGAAINGVTVTNKVTKKSVQTNARGEFNIEAKEGDILIFTSIGYAQKEIKVGAYNEIGIIQLTVSESKLDEVQIIAYGKTTQRLSTGNVTTVKADVIEKQPVNNPLLALQGRVPGLFIEQATGFAGTGVKVRIQGQNSINNGNDPLYVVDGVPFLSQLAPLADYTPDFKGLSGGDRTNGSPLNFINPADIESIDVLKDADATAIYGSRAANGAILITTKRGKLGETRVDINAQTGIGRVPRRIDMLNTSQYLEMRNEALKNENISSPAYYEYDINGAWSAERDIDWQKELIGKSAEYSDVQTSVSGGSNNTTYLLGTGYHRETNVFPGNFADNKVSVHANINTSSINQRFKLQFLGSYLSDINKLPTVDLTQLAVILPPNAPEPFNADGSLNWQPNSSGTTTFPNNPLAYFKNTYTNKTNTLISSGTISYQILEGLQIKSSFGFTSLNSNQSVLYPTSSQKPENLIYVRGYSSFSTNNSTTWIIEPQLTFNRNIDKGKLEFLIGSTLQQNVNNDYAILGSNFISDLLIGDLKSAPDILVTQFNNSTYKYNALYGRLNYNWINKYILNVTGRRDGSSNFGPKSQFHNFGAVGAAWIFSETDFIKKHLMFLSQGKLRMSYGTTGSDQIGSYQFLDLYESIPAGVPYQGGLGLRSNRLNNPYLQWEETKKFQVGFDLGIANDRVLLNVNYNRNRSSNQLTSLPLPIITGSTNILYNLPAVVQNTGWEISLNTENIRSNSIVWTSGFNITIPRNKLVSFIGADLESNDAYILGQPLSIKRVYRFAGVNENSGLYQFINNQGNITLTPSDPIDKTVLVNTDPKFYGGLQNSIRYKAFLIDVLLQFVKQKGSDWTQLGSTTTAGKLFGNASTSVLDRWKKPGDQTNHQLFSIRNGSNASFYASQSDLMYTDASYIKLKNISVSWTAPIRWAKTLHIKNINLFIHGQNLITFTNYKGLDPETKVLGLPPLRTMTFGAKVTL